MLNQKKKLKFLGAVGTIRVRKVHSQFVAIKFLNSQSEIFVRNWRRLGGQFEIGT
jgi:hypothetical protein